MTTTETQAARERFIVALVERLEQKSCPWYDTHRANNCRGTCKDPTEFRECTHYRIIESVVALIETEAL